MNIHKNARTTPYSRAEIVRRVMVLRETPRAVATALGVSRRTVAKWLARYKGEGEAGIAERRLSPHQNGTEERRVGNERVRKCESRGERLNQKKNKTRKTQSK